MPNDFISSIVAFAEKAHEGQRRKYSDEAYVNHPLRVMTMCSTVVDDPAVLAAALLHDVLEDTPVTADEIRRHVRFAADERTAERTVRLVVELTDVFTKEKFPVLNRRERKQREVDRLARISDDAQTIKYADLIDNARNIAEHEPTFAVVYAREGLALWSRMGKGNALLRARAKEVLGRILD